MKASELIKLLQAEIDKHGDLPTRYTGKKGDVPVQMVHTYDEHGDLPEKNNKKAVEIFLH